MTGPRVTDLELIQWARAEIGRPFIWGQTNCVALALRALSLALGDDLLAHAGQHLRNRARANGFVRRYGLDGLVQRLEARGVSRLAPAFCQTGDVALVDGGDDLGAHVFLGQNWLSSTPADGVLVLPRQAVAADVLVGVR